MNLTSERLHFRQYNDNDLDFLLSLLSDPQEVRFIGSGKTHNREGAKQFLNWIYGSYKINPDFGLMVLTRKKDNVKIGHAGLVPQVINGVKEIEIGYWIARNYWHNGYATEAAKALLDYGKSNCGMRRFIALIQNGNIASQKVAKNIGMELEREMTLSEKKVGVFSVEG
ncbi:GNAT family N-acetyltransferase [Sporolactobacillus pectinivorans]|uniref:GNAT family N-acetyltransferase n=1 Tax=Sporolactobacillus pectinivorans TaxID=1591408 RepID=UPI000C26BD71|nr:GNAT family N-acetyltransferase [Sporolactobacillus pectinivorans]